MNQNDTERHQWRTGPRSEGGDRNFRKPPLARRAGVLLLLAIASIMGVVGLLLRR